MFRPGDEVVFGPSRQSIWRVMTDMAVRFELIHEPALDHPFCNPGLTLQDRDARVFCR